MSLIFHQNIEKAHKYKVVFFAKASGAVDLHVSFVGSDNTELASNNIGSFGHNVIEWTRMETVLEAKATNHNASPNNDKQERSFMVRSSFSYATGHVQDGKTAWEHGRRDLVTSET
ncbi:hypothetical protein VIGAN_01318900 [Vigna angularis var. angularis]|uniref:Uncharacterized protein n=1 Tax=Vigna angularis var. angularis TaxID=157739 RepID=A0A0S3R4D3_PHAAN|nr:hypothetical protein VIGAN_01318900 [Vigna angularis var. angularis]